MGAGQSSGKVKAKSTSYVEDLRLISLCVNDANWLLLSNDKGKKLLQISKLDSFLSPPHTGEVRMIFELCDHLVPSPAANASNPRQQNGF